MPTIRDKKNIALSSRNQFLKNKEIELRKIPVTLNKIRDEILKGNFKISTIENFKKNLLQNGIDNVNYLEILNEKNLSKIGERFCYCRIFISVSIDDVKLIDNKSLGAKIKLIGDWVIVDKD